MDFQSVILKSNPKTALKMGILCFWEPQNVKK